MFFNPRLKFCSYKDDVFLILIFNFAPTKSQIHGQSYSSPLTVSQLSPAVFLSHFYLIFHFKLHHVNSIVYSVKHMRLAGDSLSTSGMTWW
jgi:hypothetical protein